MAETDDLRLPLEIPWRLASTTQPLAIGDPAGTSMSLFFFEPDDENLTRRFPDEKLVFVKITASVSPAVFPAGRSPVAAPFLGDGIPCFHLLLDLKVTAPGAQPGTTRPYFHAAAPLQRRMIQTGVAGAEVFEGEADTQFIGKSGSQLYESLHSTSTTSSASASVSFLGFGGSVRRTSTDVDSDRSVAQVVDTTTRQAAEERRQLVSHLSRVENILTLLNAKHLGTPHLTFSLSPRPLQLLSIDPADPNLWFHQLLARRSSGIEGVQEFTAVIVVPRDEGFCVVARLRRVCLFDTPPGPLRLDEPFIGSFVQVLRTMAYLQRTYPPGTPLEELDIDILTTLASAQNFPRPVIETWALRSSQVVEALVVSPSRTPGGDVRGGVNYKHILELWLETLEDEYEQEVARSPLERGVLLGENRHLVTCFAPQAEGGMLVTTSSSSVSPLFPVDLSVGDAVNTNPARGRRARTTRTVRSQAIDTITQWDAVERQAVAVLNSRTDFPETPVKLGDPRIRRVLLDRWEKLSPDDPRNLDFGKAADALALSSEQRALLRESGANDLRSIAHALKVAPEVERQNREIQRIRKILEDRKSGITPPDPLHFSISPNQGQAIEKSIASALLEPV